MSSRESDEMSERQFWEQFAPEPGIDAEGYYPGEKQWRLDNGVPLDEVAQSISLDTPLDYSNVPF